MILMNIFIYDLDIKTNAQMHTDSHCIKMQLELAQMLSTTFRLLTNYDGDRVYKATHQNHPSTQWVRASYNNFKYALELYYALHDEWNTRYQHDKIHKSFEVVDYIADNLNQSHFKFIEHTPFALAMPDIYKCSDAVKSYRDYFNGEKLHLAKWKNRNPPEWVNKNKGDD